MGSIPPSSSAHPATWKFGYPIYHAESRAAVARLARREPRRRSEASGCVRGGRSPARPTCPYPEVVEEAICFGWIDSTASRLDDDRGLQLLTPRKPKSTWTRLNRQRVADMEAAGLMTDAGRRAVEFGDRQRLVDDPRSRGGSPGTRRPRRSARRRPVGTARMGHVSPERAQGDAVVGDQRSQARHPTAQDRDDRGRGRESRTCSRVREPRCAPPGLNTTRKRTIGPGLVDRRNHCVEHEAFSTKGLSQLVGIRSVS